MGETHRNKDMIEWLKEDDNETRWQLIDCDKAISICTVCHGEELETNFQWLNN